VCFYGLITGLMCMICMYVGMPGCLSVGMNAAKTLAAALKKPLVGVHHMVSALKL
jgi:tRNA A37 threonylcarbamoyltransferase TsaD